MTLAGEFESASRSAPATADRTEGFGIRALRREFGVSSRTLRFYEEKGLLNPRRAGQERIYSRRDRARLQYVLMGREVGFSLDEIKEMLDLFAPGERGTAQLKDALARVTDRIGALERQKAGIDRVVAELSHAARNIEGALAVRARGSGRMAEAGTD